MRFVNKRKRNTICPDRAISRRLYWNSQTIVNVCIRKELISKGREISLFGNTNMTLWRHVEELFCPVSYSDLNPRLRFSNSKLVNPPPNGTFNRLRSICSICFFIYSVYNYHSNGKSGTRVNYFIIFICDSPWETALNPSRNSWKFYGYLYEYLRNITGLRNNLSIVKCKSTGLPMAC